MVTWLDVMTLSQTILINWDATGGMCGSDLYIVENIFCHMHSKTVVNQIMTRCSKFHIAYH